MNPERRSPVVRRHASRRPATALAVLLAASIFISACDSRGKPATSRDEWNGAACGGAPVIGLTAEQRAASKALGAALREDRGIGVTAAVVIDGRLVWSDAQGDANGEGSRLTTAAQMRIGSVSKGFTAAALARLFETHDVDLDAPIQRFVPSFPRKGRDVTLRQLATHTSGVRHYDFSVMREANNTVHYASLSEALEIFADDPLASEPGAAVSYSSFGYNLIGVAVENILGASFRDVLETTVTGPLGLSGVALDDAMVRNPCRPEFYTNLFGRVRLPTLWRDSSDYYPSGGLLATSEDMAQFAYKLFATDAFTPEARALFTERPTLADGNPGQYGFAWEVRSNADGEIEWIGLGGAANGAHASVRYYPRLRMAVAGAINYNFYLTDRRPAFFRAVREDVPKIFAGALAAE